MPGLSYKKPNATSIETYRNYLKLKVCPKYSQIVLSWLMKTSTSWTMLLKLFMLRYMLIWIKIFKWVFTQWDHTGSDARILTGSPPWTARIEQWQLSTSPLTVVHVGEDHLHDGGGTWTKSRKNQLHSTVVFCHVENDTGGDVWFSFGECNNLCMIFSLYFLILLILYIIKIHIITTSSFLFS